MDEISAWLRNTGSEFDKQLAAKRDRYINRASTAALGSDDSNILDQHFTNAERERLNEASENIEISRIGTELRRTGWHPKKTKNYPNDQVVIEWEPRDSQARDAGSATREISGNNLLDAYRNAERELLR
jgi:hypothetical protein